MVHVPSWAPDGFCGMATLSLQNPSPFEARGEACCRGNFPERGPCRHGRPSCWACMTMMGRSARHLSGRRFNGPNLE